MSELRMPSLGADMDAGTLVEWRVKVGDRVARGDVVGLIETQKATMEFESFTEGIVEELLVEPGTKVPVGTVLARLRGPGEAAVAPSAAPFAVVPPAVPSAAAPVAVAPPAAAPPIAPAAFVGAPPVVPGGPPIVGALAAPFVVGPAGAAAPPAAGPATFGGSIPSGGAIPHEVRGSPAARKLARELGIDLATVHGTGPHGAIVLRDISAPGGARVAGVAAPSAAAPPAAPAAAPPAAPAGAPAKPRRAPPTAGPVREAIAAAMSHSKREIPHYYLSHTISLKRALAWLGETNRDRSIQDRILPNALLLRAVAVALWEFPELNGFYVDGAFQPAEEVHLGTAISLRTGGLIAPAILDADSISLEELMRELQDLVIRTRAGHLKSTEMTSATITVTSLGDRGCETVFPVINPPQVAMIGFGAIIERPWVEGTAVVPHPTVVATLAADHRVSDGHRGGLFLATLDRLLQEPSKL